MGNRSNGLKLANVSILVQAALLILIFTDLDYFGNYIVFVFIVKDLRCCLFINNGNLSGQLALF